MLDTVSPKEEGKCQETSLICKMEGDTGAGEDQMMPNPWLGVPEVRTRSRVGLVGVERLTLKNLRVVAYSHQQFHGPEGQWSCIKTSNIDRTVTMSPKQSRL